MLVVFASDYGPMVTEVFRALAVLVAVALLLGAGTAAVAARCIRRKWAWWLAPIFALPWLAVIFWCYGGVPTTWRSAIPFFP
jgi:hypothetical protein